MFEASFLLPAKGRMEVSPAARFGFKLGMSLGSGCSGVRERVPRYGEHASEEGVEGVLYLIPNQFTKNSKEFLECSILDFFLPWSPTLPIKVRVSCSVLGFRV